MASRLPLHDLHARSGARLVEARGWLLPQDYGDPAAEYAALRERAGVIDRSDRGAIEATGRDRVGFLQGMLSSDVKALAPGQGGRAAFLDVHGKVLALLVVHCRPDRLVLELDRAEVAATLAGLDRFLISERVELEDAGAAHGVLTVIGPAARATVEKLVEQTVADLAPWHHVPLEVAGEPVRVVRDDEAGEEAYDLWVEAATLERWWERAVAAGARPVGREAWNVRRVEAGRVAYGVDVDATTLLLETPLEDAYSLTKGCYVGQEVVARITYRGHVNRKIVGFRFPDARRPESGAAVRAAGKEAGRITSAVVSPTLRHAVALGFLRREHWTPGTRVEVDAPGGAPVAPLVAEVAALPFLPRAGG